MPGMMAMRDAAAAGLARLTPRRVQDLLDESITIAVESGREHSLSEIFLDRLCPAFGAVWIRVCESSDSGLRGVLIAGDSTAAAACEHVEFLRETAAGDPGELRERVAANGVRCTASATDLAPGITLVVELGFAAGSGLAEWSESAVEIFADLRRRELVARLQRLGERLNLTDALIRRLYAAPDVAELLQVLTTESAALLGCFRATVCERTGNDWRITAVTGGAEVNERADEVRRICSEVRRAAGGMTGEQQRPLSGKSTALTIPLSRSGTWQDCRYGLHLEYHGAGGGVAETDQRERLVRHAVQALEHRTRLSVDSRAPRRRRWLWLAAGSAAAGFLAFVPVDLTISASGELQPASRQSVYVQESGTVDEVLADDGREVGSGDLLLRLRNDDLRLQEQSLLGELSGVRARQAALGALRSSRDGQQSGLQGGELAELEARAESLNAQLVIQRRRLESLQVRSPLSGRILSDDLRERFQGRPVQRGQHVCDVGDLHGDWELQLKVSELDVRHLLTAAGINAGASREQLPAAGSGTRPQIEYFLETSPERSYTVELGAVAGAAELDARGSLMTAVTANISGELPDGLRPGAGVRAVIHCGQAPAGYVYFRRLIDVLLRQTLL
jgi:multidrug efflux pump subunit AcrA (membrane-fusion protein)